MARTLPLVAPPQKNRSLPSASSPLTVMPAGISRRSRTSPFSGSTRRISLCSPSIVACQSSPSTHETPVTNRSDSMVRRIAPVFASTWWILRARYSPTQRVPSAHVRPESPPRAAAGMLPSTRPVEVANGALHRPLARAEGVRQRGGGPRLAALEQRQDRPSGSVDRRREHHHRMRRARRKHEAHLGRVDTRERSDGGPHAPDLDAQPRAV